MEFVDMWRTASWMSESGWEEINASSVCVFMCVKIHACVCVYMCACVCVYMCVCMCVYMCVYMYMCACMCVSICVHVCVYEHDCCEFASVTALHCKGEKYCRYSLYKMSHPSFNSSHI